MSSTKRIALVTGANRGIGFEICRQLAQRGLHVVLASRDAARGRAAAGVLRNEGLEVETRTLDVTSARSINALAAWIGKSHGRLDVLVN
ncbi:MAG: SDR family NAD(P)-dependent oxidoreductase, partial [Burkholderiales bacterium]|nr:SDR family NAD(P)-dependent oxidoreductase [Burkholderiales bacterium]